ncbi:DegT/DnrJ/EryC1/StrS aminotransferase family protein [Thermomonospora echinospora]|uniref:DegT/DnrJ/EryC1/StrS aminotransferase family protein n=1 Tax=Thermomonospora echinospora TaxID=1992 RepID=A0A1H6E9V1_9ACTN|nr:DegT/DnrJ/EryC1/StrS aminotransferase family protein [Thermomonospora echinospora]
MHYSPVPESPVYGYGCLTAEPQLERVSRAIASGRLSAIGGSQVPELERLTAFYTGRAYALATSSATAGLEVALRALGIGGGWEVVVPALGWVSVAGAVAATGATVRVAPIEESLTPSWDHIAPLVGPTTAAVVVAHLRGRPASDIARIAAELRNREIPLIEDCAQAWGAGNDHSRPVGRYGKVAVFSVQAYKLIAAGEGGLTVCDDADLMAKMRTLAGDTRVPAYRPTWRGNSRMSEITAALAIPQLQALDDLTGQLRRLQRQVADLLTEQSSAEIVLPQDREPDDSNGMHVGAWWPSAQAAQTLWQECYSTGLCAWHPTPGDLHSHHAWPVQAESESADISRYLDLQIPALHPRLHHTFLDSVRSTLDKAGLLTRPDAR